MSDTPARGLPATLGLILCRLVVPAWILTGALFKLAEANPGLLPRNILIGGDRLGLDLDVLLATLISLELLAAAAILLIGRLARPMAIFMLSAFALVLLGEIAKGNTSCGCLGANSPSPWVMLAIDGGLLLGVILLRPRRLAAIDAARWPWVVAGLLAVAGAAASFARLVAPSLPTGPADPGRLVSGPARADGPRPTDPPAGEQPVPPKSRPDEAAGAEPLPSYWFEGDLESWVGRGWDEIDLFRFVPAWPPAIDDGERYVVFYGRACDHCQTMFERDLEPDPSLAARVIAVEVPYERDRLRSPDAWPLPDTACELVALPVGVDWIITTPLTLRLQDGVVQCATEGDHTECMGLPPLDD